MSSVVVVGSFVQDLAFITSQFPRPGETRIGKFVTGPGGKGFNQAVACHRLGAATLFLGAVGEDLFAHTIRSFSKAEELPIALEVHPLLQSGAASIVVNAEGLNLIVVALGANAALSTEFIHAQGAAFEKARVVVCQLECNLAATACALELGREAGAKTILNPAPINDSLSRDLFDNVDILVPNESEAEYLLRRFFNIELGKDLVTHSDAELGDLCSKMQVPCVVLTLGAQGAFLFQKESGRYQRFPAAQVNPMDTTGAGDSFTGALAAGLVRFKNSVSDAVGFAVRASGLSTEKQGTAPSMPVLAEVLQRFPA